MELNKAIKTVWSFIGRMNKYIDETMPWVLAKSEDAHDKARLQSAMYHLAEALRIIAILVSPVIPVGAPKNLGTIRGLQVLKRLRWKMLKLGDYWQQVLRL